MSKISIEAQRDITIEGDVVGGNKGADEKERPQEPEQKQEQGGITITWDLLKKVGNWLIRLIPLLLSFVKSANASDGK